jgi:hypothetical protein
MNLSLIITSNELLVLPLVTDRSKNFCVCANPKAFSTRFSNFVSFPFLKFSFDCEFSQTSRQVGTYLYNSAKNKVSHFKEIPTNSIIIFKFLITS